MNDNQKTFLLMALLAGLVFCVSRAHAQVPVAPRAAVPVAARSLALPRAAAAPLWPPAASGDGSGECSAECSAEVRAREAAAAAVQSFDDLDPVALPRRIPATSEQLRLRF